MSNTKGWHDVKRLINNSVVHILTRFGKFNSIKPYATPTDASSSGSGFLIDQRGFVVTNAHVVKNAISVQVRFADVGKEYFPCTICAVCPEKDIALLRIDEPNLEKCDMKKRAPLLFCNDATLLKTQPVMAVGYPLGHEEINFTTGVVSGFNYSEEDSKPVSYVQVTAPINPGNSGGPLVDQQGRVVGVNAAGYLFSQNIGFAIPSRVVLGLLEPMFKLSASLPDDRVVHLPPLGIHGDVINEDMLATLGLDPKRVGTGGMLVADVQPDGCAFGCVEKDDVITHMCVVDDYVKNGLSASDYMRGRGKTVEQRVTLGVVDRFGMVKGYRTTADACKAAQPFPKDSNQNPVAGSIQLQEGRKMKLVELLEGLRQKSTVRFLIWRKGRQSWVSCEHKRHESNFDRIQRVHWGWQPIDFEVLFGMCLCPISLNLIDIFEACNKNDASNGSGCRALHKFDDPQHHFDKAVVVTNVFAETMVANAQSVEMGDIVEALEIYDLAANSVEKHQIQTLGNVRAVLQEAWCRRPPNDDSRIVVVWVFASKTRVACGLQEGITSDAATCKRFSIKPTEFMNTLLQCQGAGKLDAQQRSRDQRRRQGRKRCEPAQHGHDAHSTRNDHGREHAKQPIVIKWTNAPQLLTTLKLGADSGTYATYDQIGHSTLELLQQGSLLFRKEGSTVCMAMFADEDFGSEETILCIDLVSGRFRSAGGGTSAGAPSSHVKLTGSSGQARVGRLSKTVLFAS